MPGEAGPKPTPSSPRGLKRPRAVPPVGLTTPCSPSRRRGEPGQGGGACEEGQARSADTRRAGGSGPGGPRPMAPGEGGAAAGRGPAPRPPTPAPAGVTAPHGRGGPGPPPAPPRLAPPGPARRARAAPVPTWQGWEGPAAPSRKRNPPSGPHPGRKLPPVRPRRSWLPRPPPRHAPATAHRERRQGRGRAPPAAPRRAHVTGGAPYKGRTEARRPFLLRGAAAAGPCGRPWR